MLQKLHIQNYAIIDELVIDFSSNLNIITGETGAGKSILVGALSLILGERAESSILMNKNQKCLVEGSFKINDKAIIRDFLKEQDLDEEDDLVVRREIAVNGKSRAFINDTPVNLVQLKQLSSMLVDLHQQFDTLELGDNDFQREVIDALGDNGNLLLQYKNFFHQYQQAKKELIHLQEQQQNASAVADYNSFLFNELEEAAFRENELEELDTELKLLSNAENVKQQLAAVYVELNESEQPIVNQLKVLVNKLFPLEVYHSSIPDLLKRLQSAQLELKDIGEELESINDHINYSPDRIQLINDRLSLGYKLQKKHGVNSTSELIAIKNSLQEKLQDILNISDAIRSKEKEAKDLFEQCKAFAIKITANRQKVSKPFSQQVNTLLAQVGMPNAILKVDLQAVDFENITEYGADNIEFLFDANKSNHFEPLRKVASGGELSRLMLCIKSLVAKKLQLPTLIFDEIDSGISGEAAKQVGMIMKGLSVSHQLISITHQPQIAAKADTHYFIYKSIKGDKITTSVKVLNNDERITAIAQMLSGEKPTAAAIENAREMVRN